MQLQGLMAYNQILNTLMLHLPWFVHSRDDVLLSTHELTHMYTCPLYAVTSCSDGTNLATCTAVGTSLGTSCLWSGTFCVQGKMALKHDT